MIYFEIDGSAKCRACGKKFETNEIATAIVAEAGAGAAYAHVKDGDEETVATCPECGEYGFVVAEGRCVNCGNHCNTECDRCGSGIPADEITGSGFCGYCDYVMSKDD